MFFHRHLIRSVGRIRTAQKTVSVATAISILDYLDRERKPLGMALVEQGWSARAKLRIIADSEDVVSVRNAVCAPLNIN
jgi:hypothetical protein